MIFIILKAINSAAAVANSYSNELKVYIIRPKYRLDWKSPRAISITSAINSFTHDYAPIGHFAVELKCDAANKYGVKHILTGMEREDKKNSRQITLKKKLELGSVFYNFTGDFQKASQSARDIDLARKDRRLTTVTIPTSTARCQKAMEFLDNWIQALAPYEIKKYNFTYQYEKPETEEASWLRISVN